MPNQIVCSCCRTLLICPARAPSVQCGACNTVTKVYPQGHPTYVDSYADSSEGKEAWRHMKLRAD
ncbi:hypothetical protein FCM35_KLT12283 [Carex littledalei]|uniref:Zinc finger LSD1-type domain-containing protein n=1 Tax=Carex littledalei TaxID=544730 RepID=A0A833QR39_9POAL|nr:hypothetical protein FCM35_KLT12283 [Carex littledalei]